MTEPTEELRTIEEYRSAVEALERAAAGDEAARDLLRGIARVLRYEAAHGLATAQSPLLGFAVPAAPPPRTAIISDIHGNIAGLLAVLADIERRGCDRIVCLGDLVEGGEGDEEVVETLRRRGIRSVRGNHDEHNDVALREDTRRFLGALPEAIFEADVIFTHISPRRLKRKVNHAVEAWNVFQDVAARIVFVGHAHVPLVFAERCDSYGEARPVAFEYDTPWRLDPQDRYVVCVGSVGYGRDDVGKPRYAIYDRGAATVEFRAVEGPVLPMDHSLRVRFEGALELVPRSG